MNCTQQRLQTDRLILRNLELSDDLFILELVNTKGWLTFIGDRNVHDQEGARNYIKEIQNNGDTTYWVVELLDQTHAGVITLIKREHLPYYDLGFAFLPSHQGSGLAYESSKLVLNHITESKAYPAILATTIRENVSSVRLIERLGLSFYRKDIQENEEVYLYKLDLEKLKIDRLVKGFFDAFTNKETKPNLNLIHEACIDKATLIKRAKDSCEAYSVESFIAPREKLLTDGALTEFEEYEVSEKTAITRNIAQRISQHEKEGVLNRAFFAGKGTKMFQFIKVGNHWKICSLIWEDA